VCVCLCVCVCAHEHAREREGGGEGGREGGRGEGVDRKRVREEGREEGRARVYMCIHKHICIRWCKAHVSRPKTDTAQRHGATMCATCLIHMSDTTYGVATMSRLLKIIRLFCKRALQKSLYSAKETYNFKEPTSRSHPIFICIHKHICIRWYESHVSRHTYEIIGLFCKRSLQKRPIFSKETYNLKEPTNLMYLVAPMNESYHTYEWAMPHTWMSHVAHINESCNIYEWKSCISAEDRHSNTTSAGVDMAHSYVRHDSFICVIWLIHKCDMAHSYVRHGSFVCVTQLIHMCDMAHPYVCRESCISLKDRHSNTTSAGVDKAHSYVRHDSFICVAWPIHKWDMAHSYVWYHSFISVTLYRIRCHTYEW